MSGPTLFHVVQMRVSEPYLLLRNHENETTGVWFYSKEEQIKISQTVKSLLEAKKTANPKGKITSSALPEQVCSSSSSSSSL